MPCLTLLLSPPCPPLTFLQLLSRGLWLTAPNEGVKNTSAILVKICTNSPGKNITKNKWCDHLLFTLFALPTLSDTVYCFKANCHGWKQDSFSHSCCLFGKSTCWALLSTKTGRRPWASRFKLVSFTPLAGSATCWVVSLTSLKGFYKVGQRLPKRCLDSVLSGHKPDSKALTHLTGSKWGRGTRVPHKWLGTKWHLSKGMHPE